MDKNPVLLVVHGYGHIDEGRSPQELLGLGQYFSQVTDLIRENGQRIHAAVVVGGIQKRGIPEAESTLGELRRRLEEANIELPIIADPHTKSTIGVVAQALEWVSKEEYRGWELWQSCDAARYPLVLFLTRRLVKGLGPQPKYQVFPFKRKDPNFLSSKLVVSALILAIATFGVNPVRAVVERIRPKP